MRYYIFDKEEQPVQAYIDDDKKELSLNYNWSPVYCCDYTYELIFISDIPNRENNSPYCSCIFARVTKEIFHETSNLPLENTYIVVSAQIYTFTSTDTFTGFSMQTESDGSTYGVAESKDYIYLLKYRLRIAKEYLKDGFLPRLNAYQTCKDLGIDKHFEGLENVDCFYGQKK